MPMRWEQDEDDTKIQLLLGEDSEGELIELGRVEPGRPGFWRWFSPFAIGAGGADSERSAKLLLIEELKATSRMLLSNLKSQS